MRKNIVHPGAGELTYEIRGIVKIARELGKLGLEITWENIGDPVQKGETIPEWIKSIVHAKVDNDLSWAYCPTKGIDQTREFLAATLNKKGRIKIKADDILFFNGLGDAVSKIYGFLHPSARVIQPSPAYSTHSSAEGAHAGDDPITYNLNPENNWFPDLEELENKVRYNPNIAGILIINPDNPTGMVYPKSYLEKIVEITQKYGLFIIADETYTNLSYSDVETAALADMINSTPAIAMKGVSKEVPWPGARCGWIEVYNKEVDPVFSRYIDSIENAKMLEVCSTTLPQMAVPEILGNPNYQAYVKGRNAIFKERAQYAYDVLKNVPGAFVNKTQGAFYMSIILDANRLNHNQFLEIDNPQIKQRVETLCRNAALDRRFVYYLLGSTGICVVPMTGFCSSLPGFRVTLLETDQEKFRWIFNTLAEKIQEYLASA